MYSRESVGWRMELLVTPALTGYFCEDIPTKTTWSRLLLRKKELLVVLGDKSAQEYPVNAGVP